MCVVDSADKNSQTLQRKQPNTSTRSCTSLNRSFHRDSLLYFKGTMPPTNSRSRRCPASPEFR